MTILQGDDADKTMGLEMKCGFDGNPSLIEQVRDVDGQGKRIITREVRVDTIERMFRAHVIQEYQRDAARQLQGDAHRAELRSRSSGNGMPSTRTLYALSDAQDKAMSSHFDARRAVDIAMGRAGTLGATLLRLVVIEGHTLQVAAKIMKEDHRTLSVGLRFALDALARNYGMA